MLKSLIFWLSILLLILWMCVYSGCITLLMVHRIDGYWSLSGLDRGATQSAWQNVFPRDKMSYRAGSMCKHANNIHLHERRIFRGRSETITDIQLTVEESRDAMILGQNCVLPTVYKIHQQWYHCFLWYFY